LAVHGKHWQCVVIDERKKVIKKKKKQISILIRCRDKSQSHGMDPTWAKMVSKGCAFSFLLFEWPKKQL
jgi:hypothetical protein